MESYGNALMYLLRMEPHLVWCWKTVCVLDITTLHPATETVDPNISVLKNRCLPFVDIREKVGVSWNIFLVGMMESPVQGRMSSGHNQTLLWFFWWEWSPILDLHTLPHTAQVNVSASSCGWFLNRFMHLVRFSANFARRFASKVAIPAWQIFLHPGRSSASDSYESGLISEAFMLDLRTFRYLFICPPLGRWPDSSSP